MKKKHYILVLFIALVTISSLSHASSVTGIVEFYADQRKKLENMDKDWYKALDKKIGKMVERKSLCMGRTILHLGVLEYANVEMSFLNVANTDERHTLQQAYRHHLFELLKLYLTHFGQSPFTRDADGQTPYGAAQAKDAQAVINLFNGHLTVQK